jgi:type I restriction enzyme R subunit
VLWEALEAKVGKDFDAFDLICHVAFDQPPLTRRERAENVKKRNYFAKYQGAARQVLEACWTSTPTPALRTSKTSKFCNSTRSAGLGAHGAGQPFGGKAGYTRRA